MYLQSFSIVQKKRPLSYEVLLIFKMYAERACLCLLKQKHGRPDIRRRPVFLHANPDC